MLCVAQNHRLQAHRHCCLQITGSPPLLSDLDILCEMEHEGPIGVCVRVWLCISADGRVFAMKGKSIFFCRKRRLSSSFSKFVLGLRGWC